MITFLARHTLALLLLLLVGCLLWTVLYLALLAIAILGNQPLGGPLAYPAGLMAVGAAVLIIGAGVFVPACAFGCIAQHLAGCRRLLSIPVVFATALLLASLWVFLTDGPPPSLANFFLDFCRYLAVPLGIYWWLTEGSRSVIDFLRRTIKLH